MSLHDEILTARQRKALRLLGPRTLERDLYLAGGTAIALHLGHRRSVDFDWFLADRIPDPLHLAGELREEGVPLEDIGHVLYALAYFDDAESERMPRMLWKATWRRMKQTIQSWVRDLSPTV